MRQYTTKRLEEPQWLDSQCCIHKRRLNTKVNVAHMSELSAQSPSLPILIYAILSYGGVMTSSEASMVVGDTVQVVQWLALFMRAHGREIQASQRKIYQRIYFGPASASVIFKSDREDTYVIVQND